MWLFSRLQWSRIARADFVTLTWHYAYLREKRTPQQVLNVFLTNLRKAYPNTHYIWRLEPQQRGAPHFHLMLMHAYGGHDPGATEMAHWCAETWHRIADPSSEAHAEHGVKTREIDSYRAARAYVSKYCAEVDKNLGAPIPGRQWGTSRDLPFRPVWSKRIGESEWRALKPILRRILSSREKVGEKTLDWFDGSAAPKLYISADELRRADPTLWRMVRHPRWEMPFIEAPPPEARAGPRLKLVRTSEEEQRRTRETLRRLASQALTSHGSN
jgi:hypothetical protein